MARPRKKHNINWIAEEAGVSVATVSNTLNNRSGVSEETREKIRKIISGSVYERSYRNVSPKTITVIADYLGSWYMMDCMCGIIEYTSIVGININTIIYRANNGTPFIEQLRISRCDGIIILALGVTKADLLDIQKMNVPVLMADDFCEDPKIGYINNDSYQGSFDLAQHLIELGHRQIAYLSYNIILPQQQNTLARIKGWQDALRKMGVPEKNLNLWFHTARYEEIPKVVKHMIETHCDITALMVVDDHMALAVIHAGHELGLRIPEDISITGFDDVFDAQYYFPPLTTAHHSAKEIAGKAAQALDDVLAGRIDQLPREIVPAELVVRKSTGSVPIKNKKDQTFPEGLKNLIS